MSVARVACIASANGGLTEYSISGIGLLHATLDPSHGNILKCGSAVLLP